jgi:hypothetical protein
MLNIKSNIAFFLPPDPIRPQGYQDTLRAIRPENDPEGPPPKKPGDANVVGFAILGLLVGGAAGFFISIHLDIGIIIISTFAGIIIGGVVGALIGEALKKRRFRHHQQTKNS